MKIYKLTTEKLKELKTWAQVKSPKTFQPVLSYALDWLAPELLGTGFRLFEINEFEMKAIIPANKSNFDSQNEIHQGLVTNAGLELARAFLQRQMPESFFKIVATDIHLSKKQKWSDEIKLVLKSNQADMDEFFMHLQRGKKSNVQFEVTIAAEKFRKNDSLEIKLVIESTPLIA
ncbi:MAG: hypothetical protein H7328_09010 [Bdellovibrio sp.]|nr:hypothetical protein [Bdellovibrio sp.]